MKNTVNFQVEPEFIDKFFKELWVDSPSKAVNDAMLHLWLDKNSIIEWLTGHLTVEAVGDGEFELVENQGGGVSIEDNLKIFEKKYIETAESVWVYISLCSEDEEYYGALIKYYMAKQLQFEKDLLFLLELTVPYPASKLEEIKKKVRNFSEQREAEELKSNIASAMLWKKDTIENISGFIDPEGNIWGSEQYYTFIHRNIMDNLRMAKLTVLDWLNNSEEGWIRLCNGKITWPVIYTITDKQLEILLDYCMKKGGIEVEYYDEFKTGFLTAHVIMDVLSGKVSRECLQSKKQYEYETSKFI